ncbi:MAG TPA: 2-dehydropantoate 2-reductase [Solirubrobacteraceae bacterium]|nr:2-dehydropantoate 2-reductase [Solirubrobacteraceae bacterium]
MRFVVFGAGAIGGVVGARLHQAGFAVSLIARGEHRDAIRRAGLTLVTPEEHTVLEIPVAGGPAEVGWTGEDVVLLATKSQDTLGALTDLRAAAGPTVPVVCLQNGVENERLALRLVDSVYGAVVMCPAAHLQAGVVEAYTTTVTGMIDIGRYPDGVDARCEDVCAALEGARFDSHPTPDVMRLKHAKLLLNLANVVHALFGPGDASDEVTERAQAEARAVLTAAGVAFVADEVTDIRGRWERMGVRDIEGRARAGSSTWQSLSRGTALETDYLNGEIVLQGRLHGVPTPVNELLCRRAWEAVQERRAPGSLDPGDVLAVAA